MDTTTSLTTYRTLLVKRELSNNSGNTLLFISLKNQVGSPYCNLQTKFFPPHIYGPSTRHTGHKSEWKKQGSVTDRMDQENKVIEIFIKLLGSN